MYRRTEYIRTGTETDENEKNVQKSKTVNEKMLVGWAVSLMAGTD